MIDLGDARTAQCLAICQLVVSLVHTSHGLDSAAKVQMVRMCSDLVEAELGFA